MKDNTDTNDLRAFENFLTVNGFEVKKDKNGVYSFLNRLIYSEWRKNPDLAAQKINKFRNPAYALQG